MPGASDIFGTVFKLGTGINLARIVGSEGTNMQQADFASLSGSSSGDCGVTATYSIFLLDDQDADRRSVVSGHQHVTIDIADVVFDTLVDDDLWDVDDTGYNFKHTILICDTTAFAVAGRRYLIEYRLVPATGQPIIVRFRLDCI